MFECTALTVLPTVLHVLHCTAPQEERYKKERATYLRAKQKQDQQAARRGKGGRHSKHKALEGVKKKGKVLKPPKKPALAVVRSRLFFVRFFMGFCGCCCSDHRSRPVAWDMRLLARG